MPPLGSRQDTLDYPVLEFDWGADEELKLLEGIERYGMGNWADIAEFMVTKTLQEVEKHYLTYYINPPSGPTPVRG